MPNLYRIAVIGTKRPSRRYISGTAEEIELSDRAAALHWDKRVAKILSAAFNAEFSRTGRPERFQIERSHDGAAKIMRGRRQTKPAPASIAAESARREAPAEAPTMHCVDVDGRRIGFYVAETFGHKSLYLYCGESDAPAASHHGFSHNVAWRGDRPTWRVFNMTTGRYGTAHHATPGAAVARVLGGGPRFARLVDAEVARHFGWAPGAAG